MEEIDEARREIADCYPEEHECNCVAGLSRIMCGQFLIGKPASDQVRTQKYRCVGCNQKLRKPSL